MKTFIAIFYNQYSDDLFAGIIGDDRCFCYSKIGQHSTMSKTYLTESVGAVISDDSIQLWNEVKGVYADNNPTLITASEFIDIVNDESPEFNL